MATLCVGSSLRADWQSKSGCLVWRRQVFGWVYIRQMNRTNSRVMAAIINL